MILYNNIPGVTLPQNYPQFPSSQTPTSTLFSKTSFKFLDLILQEPLYTIYAFQLLNHMMDGVQHMMDRGTSYNG